MKWLKKNSSDNEQISTAESQPVPEHVSSQAPEEEVYAPEPETLEQPAADESVDEIPISYPVKQSGRRRNERVQEDTSPSRNRGHESLKTLKNSWFGRNWKIFAILMAIFCLALFARAYYGLEPATEDGFVLSGGSDSYYHHHVITTGSDTGDFHFKDPMLNYPVGTRNPRPPLYDWSVTLTGAFLSPLFDGDIYASTFYVFLFSTAFWGALTIFPTYFLGKEAFGKKTGIFAAFILALIPGHVQRSVLSNADHDAMTLFFMVVAFYFFLKALKTIIPREWITDWLKPKEVFNGIKSFITSNPTSVLYGVLAGLSITGVALIWQGFAYAIVLISVYFLAQILINRFRNVDSLGVFIIYFTAIGTGLLFAFPYYYQSIQIPSWFDTPFYLFLALSVFALILIATRKYPWLLVFTCMVAFGLIATFILQVFAPSILDSMVNALLSGGGYFINNKQYQTIAEAQAPPFSNLALSFGIITFWLSFIGVAWAAIQLPKSWKPDFTFILLWAGTSIYMAVSAARFMFNAAPAFSIAAGWIVAIIVAKLDFRKYLDSLRRASKPHMTLNFKIMLSVSITVLLIFFLVMMSVSNIAYPVFVIGLSVICGIYMLNLIAETNPNRLYNLLTVMVPALGALFYILAEFYTKWAFNDATHIFILSILLFSYFIIYMQVRKISFFFTAGVLFLAFCIVVPNVWYGLDAGIPYEVKTDYDKQIYNSMPVFLQPSGYDAVNGTNWYLGGFGYSLPLNNRYWPAAYDWLASQDADIYPPQNRPAFLSWWDYGFEVVNEGQHPAVADNFLGGHQLAGNFIMAQSEEDAIALLCVRILEGNHNKFWEGKANAFDPEVIDLLEGYGINTGTLNNIFKNPSSYVKEILANPDIYGPRDDVIQDVNAIYIASRVLITQTLDETQVVNLYNDLSKLTGHSIRYFGIDSRLFPFSAENTGIFYAPAKLSDHRISDVANQPYDFWEIKAIGEYGGEYDLDDIPLDVMLNPDEPYRLVYKDMFYDTMLYKAFIGYSGSDIGSANDGIPSLSGSLSSNSIMPGWNMSHFKLVHRTAYWNPYSAKDIQNHTDAWKAMNYWDAYEKQQAGEGISDLSDRSSLYQGTMMLKYYHGAIISGKVMLDDGTPVGGVSVTVKDDFDIPHQRVVTDSNGEYTILAPPGDITLIASTGDVDPLYLVGSEVNLTSMYIEDYQAMRVEEDRDSDGKFDYLIGQDLIINSASLSGAVFWDLDASGDIAETEQKIGNAEISLQNSELIFETVVYSDDSGNYNVKSLPPGSYTLTLSYANRNIGTHYVTISAGESRTQNLALTPTRMSGNVTFYDGTPAIGARVRLWIPEESIEYSVMTDANGTYLFDNILYGSFYSQADYRLSASSIQMTEVGQFLNHSLDFVLYNSIEISGRVTLNGIPVPYATIKFAGSSNSIVTTDSNGNYHIILNDGDYICYLSHTTPAGYVYSALNRISLFDDFKVFNIELKPGCIVNGNVVDENGNIAAKTQVVIDNVEQGIYLSAITNDVGDYSIVVPQDIYNVQVSSTDIGSYYSLHDFKSTVYTLNIQTRSGFVAYGTTFWDKDDDYTVDEYEGIGNVRVRFEDSSGKYAQAMTSDTGDFSIILPATNTYKVTVLRNGFSTFNMGTFTQSELANGLLISLNPYMYPISGSLYYGDELMLDQDIVLDFKSEILDIHSVTIPVGRDGTYSGQLNPGIYTLSFRQNVTLGNDSQIYQIKKDLTFDTGFYGGEQFVLDIEAILRSKVSVSIGSSDYTGANITFKNGPEERTFDMSSNYESYYVQQGDYVISAVHPLNETIMVDMFDITIEPGENHVSLSLKNAVSVSGVINYNNEAQSFKKITFNDIGSNGTVSVYTDENGAYDVYLLPNLQYEIDVDYIDYEEIPSLRAYRFYSNNLLIDTHTTISNYQINVEKEDYTIELKGVASIGGSVAPYTELTFISDFGNFTAITNVTGAYSLDIPPAEYTVYAHNPSLHYVSLLSTLVEIEQDSLDFELIRGYRIYGTAYYERNINAKTQITFISQEGPFLSIDTDDSGYYELWLPSSLYTISSELTSLKNELSVIYSLNLDIELVGDRQLNLPLSMVEERIVFVSFDLNQFEEIGTNIPLQYVFEIENMGNIRDTYDIVASASTTEYFVELSTSVVTVDPGAQNKARLSLTVIVPTGTKIDQNKITITAISQKDSSVRHSNVMNLLILQNRELVIQPSASPAVFSQGNINSEFSILNKGNGPDTCTVYIANNEELLLNGWKVELGVLQGSESMNDGKRTVNVSIASGSTVNVPLYLTPVRSDPSRQARILLVSYSQQDASAITTNYVLVQYPELQVSSSNLTVIGQGVSGSQAGDQYANVGVMVISVAAALLIFYYARKKRWIR